MISIIRSILKRIENISWCILTLSLPHYKRVFIKRNYEKKSLFYSKNVLSLLPYEWFHIAIISILFLSSVNLLAFVILLLLFWITYPIILFYIVFGLPLFLIVVLFDFNVSFLRCNSLHQFSCLVSTNFSF